MSIDGAHFGTSSTNVRTSAAPTVTLTGSASRLTTGNSITLLDGVSGTHSSTTILGDREFQISTVGSKLVATVLRIIYPPNPPNPGPTPGPNPGANPSTDTSANGSASPSTSDAQPFAHFFVALVSSLVVLLYIRRKEIV